MLYKFTTQFLIMELPNQYFQDFPIEFKEINPSDFPNFETEDKIIIEPDENGFINESMQEQICLEENNTVIINASVGNGKSYAIIQTIKRYYESDEKYLIIVATPFISLVEQYVNDIHQDAKVPTEDIYDYTFLGKRKDINYLDIKVHVVTVNTLLGNPGDEAFISSRAKFKYIKNLITHCKNTDTKVVFIYDEIHDAIQNFKEEYIFNLWKWREVIHKNFIISATFNEASKVVIKYLAELTHRKIKIIESKRVRFPHKQSRLYLHYSQDYNFSATTKELVNLIEDLLYRNKNIDILCYSKNLAKSILQDTQGISYRLKAKFGEINNCTSIPMSNQQTDDDDEPKNRFDNTKCNIGTNFKTGVSIKKENHAFVIIIPPRASRRGIRNKYGIFSDGVNSVIQALARQRMRGEIHIILPQPDRFDYMTLVKARLNQEQIRVFSEVYNEIHYYEESDNVEYYSLQEQDRKLHRFYNFLKADVIREIRHIDTLDRRELPRLKYPTYELFKLRKGEDYLANNIKFYGGDLSAYITYCAFTNQFINCNLSGIINNNESLFFEPGIIQGQLAYYFNKYFGGEEGGHALLKEWKNFNKVYQDFREDLFQNFKVRYRKDNVSEYARLRLFEPYFEIQLLKFIESMYYGFDFKTNDIQYSRGDYFLDCIFIAQQINLEEKNYDKKFVSKIKFYQTLGYFREKIIQSVKKYTSDKLSYDYLENALPDDWFTYKDIEMFDILKLLLPNDDLLHSNVFIYKRNLNRKSFYKKLIEDFFETSDAKLPIGNRKNVKKIIKINPLPLNTSIINLVEPPEDLYTEELENAHIEIMGAENHKNSQQEIDQRLREY